jgi:cystathionine beta-synthase
LALAQIAIMRGYQLILVIPDKMSRQKIEHLRAMGVQIVMTRSDVNKGDPDYYQDRAQAIAQEHDDYFYINQFANPNNPKAHEESTAPEIWEQMDGDLDAIVMGAGTGGHVTGISRYMQRMAPQVKLVLADPAGSILADYINTGELKETNASWLVEGIGEDFIPETCDTRHMHEAITVNDADAFACARNLLKKEGIFAGSSSGTTIAAALRYCQNQTTPKKILSFVYDSGEKYLAKMYDDHWMKEHGFKTT